MASRWWWLLEVTGRLDLLLDHDDDDFFTERDVGRGDLSKDASLRIEEPISIVLANCFSASRCLVENDDDENHETY